MTCDVGRRRWIAAHKLQIVDESDAEREIVRLRFGGMELRQTLCIDHGRRLMSEGGAVAAIPTSR
jgi:hypothetical protein